MAENNSSAPLKTAPVSLAEHRANHIYIAGPMTGLPDLNFPAFNAAANELRVEGWHVENPAEHGIVDGAQWSDYMHTDLQQLSTCCAIYLLPGWSKSRGATLEAHVAKALGMAVYYAPNAETQAVEAQAAPAAVAVPAQKLASLVKELRMLAAAQEPEYPNFQIIIEEAAKALESATPALPATEDFSAGDLAEVPDGFGSAKHWKEKAQYWAGVAHELRGQALRGEPVDGIIQPSSQAEVQAEPVYQARARGTETSWADVNANGFRAAKAMRSMEVRVLYTAPQAHPSDALDAAFEAVRKRLCKLPRHSFHIDSRGNIRRVTEPSGNWIEFASAHALFDPVAVDAAMAAAQEGGNAAKEA